MFSFPKNVRSVTLFCVLVSPIQSNSGNRRSDCFKKWIYPLYYEEAFLIFVCPVLASTLPWTTPAWARRGATPGFVWSTPRAASAGHVRSHWAKAHPTVFLKAESLCWHLVLLLNFVSKQWHRSCPFPCSPPGTSCLPAITLVGVHSIIYQLKLVSVFLLFSVIYFRWDTYFIHGAQQSKTSVISPSPCCLWCSQN